MQQLWKQQLSRIACRQWCRAIDDMLASAADAVAGETESSTLESLRKCRRRIFGPHREHTIRRERGANACEPARTEAAGIVIRTFVEIQDDRVERSRARDQLCDVAELDANPWIVDGILRRRAERALAPRCDRRVELAYDHPRIGPERIERGAQREAHPEPADQDAASGAPIECEPGERLLGSLRRAVHQHATADHDEELGLAALAQFEQPLGGGCARDRVPGFRAGSVREFG